MDLEHKKYCGKKLRQMCDLIPPKVKCAFCEKRFVSVEAAAAHEQKYHAKMLKKLHEELQIKDLLERLRHGTALHPAPLRPAPHRNVTLGEQQ